MHDVQIEVVLLSIPADAQLRWRVVRGGLPAECAPDTRARELAGLAPDASAAVVVHSTSWRATTDGLILTYAVLPDPDPAENAVHTVPPEATVICSADASVPSPPVVEIEHVLVHALRHLSLMARTNPAVIAAVAVYPRLWDAVVARAPDVAGQLVLS